MSSLAWTRAHFATLNCVCEHDLDEPDCSTGFCELGLPTAHSKGLPPP